MSIGTLLLAAVIGYLIGSVPPGYFYVKWATGQDLTTVQSGRTGGTNSFRAAGMKVGLATGISDILKGAIAVWVASWLLGGDSAETLPWIKAAAGVFSVVGHNWSLFLGFKGGAGTTPNVGWSFAVWNPILLVTIPLLLLLFYVTGMASVVSLSVGAILPIIFGIRYFTGVDATAAYLVGSLITCGLVTFSLRPNIQRLLNGTERVVGPAAKRKAKREAG